MVRWRQDVKGDGELGGAAELPKEATGPGIPGNSVMLVQSGNLKSSFKNEI